MAALRGDAAPPVTGLWGPPGSGKSHLLQATCASVTGSAYLTGDALAGWNPEAIDGFERYPMVCLDNVDRLLGQRGHEEALFHLYNRLQDAQGRLVYAARVAPQQLEFVLPDLASRLRAATVVRLPLLNDDDAVAALQFRASRRRLELPDATARYLLNHLRRDMHTLCRLLDDLDLASLAARRRLTIPFVKSIL